MKSILFLKYWSWLPRAVKFFLIGGFLGGLGFGLLYVLPYSDMALNLLAGIDFVALVFLLMGITYAVFDLVKSRVRRKPDVTGNKV